MCRQTAVETTRHAGPPSNVGKMVYKCASAVHILSLLRVKLEVNLQDEIAPVLAVA